MVGLEGQSAALCSSILWDPRLSSQALATPHLLCLLTGYICIAAGSPEHEWCEWQHCGLLVAPRQWPCGCFMSIAMAFVDTHQAFPVPLSGACHSWHTHVDLKVSHLCSCTFFSQLSFLTSFWFFLNSCSPVFHPSPAIFLEDYTPCSCKYPHPKPLYPHPLKPLS